MDLIDQEKIFIDIYLDCDENNVNNVQVSELLSYLAPYLDSNSQHFKELKKSLDPSNTNPFITKETFLKAMSEWTEKFKNQVDFNFNPNENQETPIRQSTPTGEILIKNEFDSLNISNISAYSLTGSLLSIYDTNTLQEQNNELQYQNKKLIESLESVKNQLTALEEQNICLHNEIDRLNKNYQTDQKLIKTLQTKCFDYEKEKEEHSNLSRDNKIITEQFNSCKKTKSELESRLNQLETENKLHLETISKLNDLITDKEKQNIMLQKDLEERDAEILTIQEKESEWKEKCLENERNTKIYILENENLKSQILSYESQLNSTMSHVHSVKMDNFEPGINSTPVLLSKTSKNFSRKALQYLPLSRISNIHIKPRTILYSLPDSLDLSYLSVDSNTDSVKVDSKSSHEEDEFCEKLLVNNIESPHESLQAELSKVSKMDCFSTCEHKINQCEEEINRLLEELDKRSHEIKELKTNKEELQLELSEAHKQIETFNEEYKTTSADASKLRKNLETIQKQKHKLKLEYKQLSNKVSHYKILNRHIKNQVNEKNNEINILKKNLQECQMKLQYFDSNIIKLQEAQEEITKIKEEISVKETELIKLSEIHKNHQNLQEEYKELKKTNDKLKNEIISLEMTAKAERKKSLSFDLFNHKLNKMEEQLYEERTKTKNLTSNINNLNLEKQKLLSKLESTEISESSKRKIETLESKLQKFRKDIIELENQLLHKSKDCNETNVKNEELEKKLLNITVEYNILKSHIDDVKIVIKTSKEYLKTSTLFTLDIWNDLIKSTFPEMDLSNYISISILSQGVKDMNGPLQEDTNLLNNQIHHTTKVLKALAKMKTKICVASEKSTNINIRSKFFSQRESVESGNNESILSKLTPKNFFLKPAILTLKPKNKSHFVFPPMSPECSQPDMTDVQMHNELSKKAELELNNNVIKSPVMAEIKDPQMEETKSSEEEIPSEECSFVSKLETTGTESSTCNDTLIENILREIKIDEPLDKIEESILLDPDESEMSGSDSVSSKGEDDAEAKPKEKQEGKVNEDEQQVKAHLTRQVRSMSEGAAIVHQLSKDGDVMVFPNLQDNTLEALGLLPNGQTKERLTEEEIELKFQTLALAFNIDALTLRDRLERQQRQRDQAEDNLAAEVSRFINAVHKLNPLCVDAETTELVTGLLDRLQLIVQASRRISTSAEIFGSVQQEWRIAESVNLMLSHLRNLIKQRDAARRQLQCTKRMLQETTCTAIENPQASSTPRRLTLNTISSPVNGRVITRRRASIATIPRALESPSTSGPAGIAAAARRAAVRRVSAGVSVERPEPLPKPWDSRRAPEWNQERVPRKSLSSRPSRLELNLDLSKIHEGIVEPLHNAEDNHQSDEENMEFKTPSALLDSPLITEGLHFVLQQHTTVKELIKQFFRHCGSIMKNIYINWAENGTLHEICFIGTLFCFAMATIFLCNLIIEIELGREGIQSVPWKWVTWEEFWSLFYTTDNKGSRSR